MYDDAPLVTLLLLVRQKLNVEGRIGLTLADKERIDGVDWETLVAESHRMAARAPV